MLNANHLEVIQFCLEHALEAPVQRRIKIYRGLADICGNEQEAKNLLARAGELEASDRRCREFLFNFMEAK